MNIKTKFNMGDSVRGTRPVTHSCSYCGNHKHAKEETVEFEVGQINTYLRDYVTRNISYSDTFGLAGWWDESELELWTPPEKKAKPTKKKR